MRKVPSSNCCCSSGPDYSASYSEAASLRRYIDEFYKIILSKDVELLQGALKGGLGKLVLDGWGDVNCEPVVNVLLQTECTIQRGT